MGLLSDRTLEDLLRACAPQVLGAVVRRYGDCDRVCAYFPGYAAGDDLIADVAEALRKAAP